VRRLATLSVFAAVMVQGASPLAGQAATAVPLSIGETFTIPSAALGETRRINVYLPPDYSATPTTRLPVLYMPDGGVGEDFIHLAGLVQVSTGNGTMRPFILVGIENTQRRRDLTGPTTVARDLSIAPRVGGSGEFRRFIRTELMPAIRTRYRTTEETGIVGESLAGLFVVETFFLEPELFDTYIAFDPSLWWNNAVLASDSTFRAPALSTQKTLFLAHSSEPELAALTVRLAETLRQRHVPHLRWHLEPMPDESHATIYHPAALKAFRRVYRPEPLR
jgi:predicted alpha/beta superfamily hydrolase